MTKISKQTMRDALTNSFNGERAHSLMGGKLHPERFGIAHDDRMQITVTETTDNPALYHWQIHLIPLPCNNNEMRELATGICSKSSGAIRVAVACWDELRKL